MRFEIPFLCSNEHPSARRFAPRGHGAAKRLRIGSLLPAAEVESPFPASFTHCARSALECGSSSHRSSFATRNSSPGLPKISSTPWHLLRLRDSRNNSCEHFVFGTGGKRWLLPPHSKALRASVIHDSFLGRHEIRLPAGWRRASAALRFWCD